MISTKTFSISKVLLSRNLLIDQNYRNMIFRLNSAGKSITANGVGTTTATSTLAVITAGGFDDQRITATMKFISPTASGSEDFGVMCRFQTSEDASITDYYYARVSSGSAKLTKVVAGVFTNLSTIAFPLSQNTSVTIVLSIVGDQLTAIFTSESGVPNSITLSALDSSIPSGGLMGWRTLNSTGFCSSFVAEQL